MLLLLLLDLLLREYAMNAEQSELGSSPITGPRSSTFIPDLPPDKHLPISVIIPTFLRTGDLKRALEHILQCDPQPGEILVHIDHNDNDTGPFLQKNFPNVRCFHATSRAGPGGARNRLINEASFPYVASFDDDSWPVSRSFFHQALEALYRQPTVAAIACHIIERDQEYSVSPHKTETLPLANDYREAGCFVGCGVVMRRDAFLNTHGYTPLQYAYGMEEVDVALQLLEQGWKIVLGNELHVFHNCERSTRHGTSSVTAAHLRNIAILTILRYPLTLFPLGVAQIVTRTLYSIRERRFHGILKGLLSIPAALFRYWQSRSPVSRTTVLRMRKLQRYTADAH